MKIFCLAYLLLSPLLWMDTYSQISVSGKVIEITTGLPISGATIFVHDEYNIALKPAVRTETDADGNYELSLPYGTYHLGAYSLYEAEEDTFALVYEPGIFSLPDSVEFFTKYGLMVDFGMSKVHFKQLYQINKSGELDNNRVIDLIPYVYISPLTESRVHSNAPAHFKAASISFIEQKTW